jgi:hypothetical protein
LLESLILIGLIIDLIAAILLYYGKIFRTSENIKLMSYEHEQEIKHRLLETRLAQIGAILLIIGFFIQILGHIQF